MKLKAPYSALCVVLLFSGLLCLAACQKENAKPGTETATLQLYLTDDPGDYQAVWIDIAKAQLLVVTDSSGASGTRMDAPLVHTGRYNLLDYRNGDDTLLSSVPVPSGTVSAIRLVLGTHNTVELSNGTTVPLVVPSEVKTGATLVISDTGAEKTYGLILDFDVDRSVVNNMAGDSGNYIFSPYVRAFSKGAGGEIEGWVIPASVETAVTAISSTDTISALTDAHGYYKFQGLPEASYSLGFIPDPGSGYKMAGEGPVNAVAGQLVTADTVYLVQ
jgi:hypothetical protein